jgi:hypothetical protein
MEVTKQSIFAQIERCKPMLQQDVQFEQAKNQFSKLFGSSG